MSSYVSIACLDSTGLKKFYNARDLLFETP
jgi:hypothetical protein